MTDSISIYEQYNIDLNRLSRDYLKFPLKRIPNKKSGWNYEVPPKEDIEYLYLELNLPKNILQIIFNVCNFSVCKWIKKYSLIKSRKMIIECIERTNLKKYGRTNYFKGKDGKKAVQEANMKKYGVKYTNNEDWKKQKQKENYKLKTGYNNPSQNPEVKKKKEETCLKNYGVKYHSQLDEHKKIIKEKMTIFRNNNNYVNSISKMERLWLDELNIQDSISYRQVPFITTNYLIFVDGFVPETNTIYEFLGDYWHGNPKKFNQNEINCSDYYKRTYGELYKHTFDKFEEIKNEYNVKIIYIWESDFIKNGKIKEDWKEKMREY